MEIRVENKLNLDEAKQLKISMDKFFATDFNMRFDDTYIFLTDN